MLLRVSAQNFLSFYKEIKFDMFPNPKRTTFQNHIYKDYKIPVLKQASIYGANGSGKSNLLKLVRFIKGFVLNNTYYKKESTASNKFRLMAKNEAPIAFSIEFYHQEIYFLYEAKINVDKIEEEALSQFNQQTEAYEIIFKRGEKTFQQETNASEEIEGVITNVLEANASQSFLSLYKSLPVLKDDRIKIAYDWFENNLKILSLNRVLPELVSLMDSSSELLDFTNQLISEIGLGVEKMEVKTSNLLEFKEQGGYDELQKLVREELNDGEAMGGMVNDRTLYSIEKEEGKAFIKRFIFKQLGPDGYVGNLEYEAQSDGTARLINLIPALFEMKNKETVYFIDEIENSIHPSLIFKVMEFFGRQKTKGQLIYTTHETMLLNQQKLMRPDEVWFVEKKQGNSSIYSLNDFKEHNTINVVNGYLQGRYGAIPFIGKLEGDDE
jgi:AAA15 family ATPase/GTPase